MFYVFLIILANGVQGIRARTLPSHFKETTHLVYTSFVSVILLGSVSGLYFAQKSPAVKNTISLICILALSTLNFGLIYFYKMFIIFRRPEENTVSAFNIKRKLKFDKQFLKLSSRGSNQNWFNRYLKGIDCGWDEERNRERNLHSILEILLDITKYLWSSTFARIQYSSSHD